MCPFITAFRDGYDIGFDVRQEFAHFGIRANDPNMFRSAVEDRTVIIPESVTTQPYAILPWVIQDTSRVLIRFTVSSAPEPSTSNFDKHREFHGCGMVS